MRWRAATRDDRLLAAVWAAGSCGFLLFGKALALWAPLLPGCLFHAWTGVPCPSCGTTRAVLGLAGWDWLGALGWNPLAATSGMLALAGGFVLPAWIAGLGVVPCLPGQISWRARAALVMLLAANWAYVIHRGA